MRTFALLATICAVTFGTASALFEEGSRPLWIDVKATGYDGKGCNPIGCKPNNTLDGSTFAYSRWSCQGEILDSSVYDEGCCITYCFEEPQDIQSIKIAFHQGTSTTRTLDVFDNDNYHSTISSSGSTNGFQTYNLYAGETEELKLCLHDPKSNTGIWLSITEVRQVSVKEIRMYASRVYMA